MTKIMLTFVYQVKGKIYIRQWNQTTGRLNKLFGDNNNRAEYP